MVISNLDAFAVNLIVTICSAHGCDDAMLKAISEDNELQMLPPKVNVDSQACVV